MNSVPLGSQRLHNMTCFFFIALANAEPASWRLLPTLNEPMKHYICPRRTQNTCTTTFISAKIELILLSTVLCSLFLYNVKESSKITTLPMKRRSWDSSFCFGITQLHLGMGTFHNWVLFICCLFKYFGWTVWIYSICWRSFIISMCSIKQDFISNSLLVIR